MAPRPVQIEVEITRGLPRTQLLGLPGPAVREGAERAHVALSACDFRLAPSRTTINLSPSHERKDGDGLDLAIALALLQAHGAFPTVDAPRFMVSAGLALDGTLRAIRGCLATLLGARDAGFDTALVAPGNAAEALLVPGLTVYAPADLKEALLTMQNPSLAEPVLRSAHTARISPAIPQGREVDPEPSHGELDLRDVHGQPLAKRALEIAAAGGHNILFCGPPGSGKTMLAERLPGIMPPMEPDQQLAAMAVHGIAGLPLGRLTQGVRPCRQPHHTITRVGLMGGGRPIVPGEIALANHGVLFLDELPEFQTQALEALRQPLEDQHIVLHRIGQECRFSTQFLLVAAMNPCPCGRLGHPTHPCTCSHGARARYRNRLSGPLLDRIDLHLSLPPIRPAQLRSSGPAESSATVRERVKKASAQQIERTPAGTANARLSPAELDKVGAITSEARCLLEESAERLALTARAYHRMLRVSRTIADLAGAPRVEPPHVAEAVQYRDFSLEVYP